MTENNFKVGDIVKLKSGGPLMTVHAVFDRDALKKGVREVRCQWFAGKKLEHGIFDIATLEKADDPNA